MHACRMSVWNSTRTGLVSVQLHMPHGLYTAHGRAHVFTSTVRTHATVCAENRCMHVSGWQTDVSPQKRVFLRFTAPPFRKRWQCLGRMCSDLFE